MGGRGLWVLWGAGVWLVRGGWPGPGARRAGLERPWVLRLAWPKERLPGWAVAAANALWPALLPVATANTLPRPAPAPAGDRKSGSTHVLYDTTFSERGVLQCVGRQPRKANPFDFQLPMQVTPRGALG